MGKNGIDHQMSYGNGADESEFDDDVLDEEELAELDKLEHIVIMLKAQIADQAQQGN